MRDRHTRILAYETAKLDQMPPGSPQEPQRRPPGVKRGDGKWLQARDIPASCICRWEYRTGPPRWVRISTACGCPWHRRDNG